MLLLVLEGPSGALCQQLCIFCRRIGQGSLGCPGGGGGGGSHHTFLVPITYCPGACKCIVSALHRLIKVSYVTCDHPDGSNSGPAKLIGTDIHWFGLACHSSYVPYNARVTSHCLACRRPTFSETKRVLYSLLSVFEPSSHALQALNAPAKPAALKPAKHSPQKAAAVAAEPEPQPVKVSSLASHRMLLHGLIRGMSMHGLLSSERLYNL